MAHHPQALGGPAAGQAGGTMAAAILTLMDAGWQPTHATEWTDQEGYTWQLAGDRQHGILDFGPLVATVAASLKKAVWSAAARHWNGKGAEGGLDLRSNRQQLKHLRANRDNDACGVHHVVATAALARIAELDAGIDPICQRCSGGKFETDFRRILEFPTPAALEAGKRSQALAAEAARGHHQWPVFWRRGCTPHEWTAAEPSSPQQFELGAWQGMAKVPCRPGRVLGAGDGSGGKASADPRYRRCGHGVFIQAWPCGARWRAARRSQGPK